MNIDKTTVVKLFNYVIKHSNISESGIQFSMDNVDYALDEINLYFPSYSFDSIRKTLFILSKSIENITYEKIEKILNECRDKKNHSIINNRYFIYLPIGILIEEHTTITLFNKKIDFVTLNEVKKIVPDDILNIENIKKSIHQYDRIYIPETFIKVNIVAPSFDSALVDFWNIYQIVKTLVEFQKSWGTQYLIHNTMEDRGKINVPDWIIIKDNKRFNIHHFKLSIQSPKQLLKISSEEFDSIKTLTQIIRKKADEKTIDFIIYRSFLLYNDALEQSDFNYCFLAFWQILETITLAERNGGDTKTIVNRILPLTEKILGDKIQLIKTMNLFATKRCALVHSGITNITNENINKIKFICEIVLAWIINNKNQYKDVNTLYQYYVLRSVDNSTINSIESAINIIRKKA